MHLWASRSLLCDAVTYASAGRAECLTCLSEGHVEMKCDVCVSVRMKPGVVGGTNVKIVDGKLSVRFLWP